MNITRFNDDRKQPKIRQSIVHFSRRWATATTSKRVLRRAPGTNSWSHGGGLLTDVRFGDKFVLQSLWPILDEPDLWINDPEPDSDSSWSWTVPRIKTDENAARRIESLERAEQHKRTRERLRPRAGEERLSIRLMVEYGVDWPLWGDEGPMEPWQFGLSIGLTERLRSWDELWETRHDYDAGWKTKEDQKQFKREEKALAVDLAEEVAPFADLEPVDN
jgi:hypothetical protein